MSKEDSSLYVFAPETPKENSSSNEEVWEILIVDDDEPVHEVTKLALKGFVFEGKGLAFYSAYSALEAKRILKERPEIAVIFLDVVMESDEAGLALVKYIREELSNLLVRIVIRTGQPGYAPKKEVIRDYDINDYKEKTELTSSVLFTTLTVALRALSSLKKLAAFQQETQRLVDAASRFLPKNFLKLLNKKHITEVVLGDHIEQEMTVLFLDIRSFTTLSEFLSPLEVFQFINQCMSYLEPMIAKNHGFIDKYIGDALMALFPGKAEDAVQAGISMLESLENYNYGRMKQYQMPIEVRIGINTGWVVMGAVGSNERMDCTAISDVVNAAARIEKLNKYFGSHLLISEATFNVLGNPSKFHYRYLGKTEVPGKKMTLGTYEIFGADPEKLLVLKEKTLSDFNQAVAFYQVRNFTEAKALFLKILEINDHDQAARYFLEEINNILKA